METGYVLLDEQPKDTNDAADRNQHQKVQFTKNRLVIFGLVAVACIGAMAVRLRVGEHNNPPSRRSPLPSTSKTLLGEFNQAAFRTESYEDAEPTSTSEYDQATVSTEGYQEEPTATIPPPSKSILGKFNHAAVSSDGKPCAQIANKILQRNGTAADATIAGLFCVGVINTQSMGMGGGFLMTYYDHSTGKAYSLNARESAPLAAYENMYNGSLSEIGGLAVAVPGEVRGYYELYERFGGGLPWAELLEPTIKLCEDGHLVNKHMAKALRYMKKAIMDEPSLSVFINNKTGDVYKEGEILMRPQLAQTLRILQQDPDALYSGELAPKLVEDLESFDSIITLEDLRTYKPVWKEAMNITLQHSGLHMFSVPPPGSGLILGFILNILDEYGLTPESVNDENIVLTYHRITEAMKWAYAKRTELGDADFVDMSLLAKNLTSDDYAAYIKNQILDNRTFQDPAHYGAVTANPDDYGTAHFSLLAPNGDAVSATSTINLYFGAKIRSVQTGIVLNNQMIDFSVPNIAVSFFGVPPSPSNFIRPGKRPLSSMSPAVFVDKNGDVRLIVGAAGGTKISSGVAWVSLRNLWLGDDIKEAIDARRIHHQLFPMTFSYEHGTLPKIVSGLEELGHDTAEFRVGGSVVCGIGRSDNGKIYANSGFRKGEGVGEVDGF